MAVQLTHPGSKSIGVGIANNFKQLTTLANIIRFNFATSAADRQDNDNEKNMNVSNVVATHVCGSRGTVSVGGYLT